jgi:hypothetical protein
MPGSTFDDLQTHNASLIMKSLEVGVFAGPSTAPAVTTLTDPTSKLLMALPAGYGDLGWLSDDGAQFSSDISTSDITGAGSTAPLRSDITADTTTLQVACLETNMQSIGIYTGQDMTAVVPNATSGEVSIAKPTRPVSKFYRVLAIGVDFVDGAGEFYVGRFLPNMKVTDKDDQAFQSSDDSPVTWSVTLTAFEDSTLGYAEKYFWGGPGWFAKLAAMGFTIDDG